MENFLNLMQNVLENNNKQQIKSCDILYLFKMTFYAVAFFCITSYRMSFLLQHALKLYITAFFITYSGIFPMIYHVIQKLDSPGRYSHPYVTAYVLEMF